ncbi:L-amino-acid oxidase isoform X1 [Salmo salar]|uniref:Amine oxidase n=2 Tax=Salmo salar TaxID=8030 RepID=A0A1S3SY48_SALSA|nr:L-amino-acid oxidase isoform X1 [Salmo salar]|eukprot:XP_014069265.1 PREDICTED: L-amino-acid oxidase-like isoform X1 [Salmo salar]
MHIAFEKLPLMKVSISPVGVSITRKGKARTLGLGVKMIPYVALCKYFPVAIVVVIVFSVNGYIDDPLLDCMQDSDYAELLEIVNRGLPFTKTPHHIAIIGGGIAGLTAAKFLEDAGHKVTLIEASGRIGGRVETYRNRREGWYAELGAMRIPSFHKILLSFALKMGLGLNPFIQDDINTYYYVNGLLQKTYTVKENPDVLNYPLTDKERGKSAGQLFDLALWKIRDDIKTAGCKAMLRKYDSYSVKEYLVKEGNLSRGALRMIGDILNENSLFYASLTEMLYIQSDINDNTVYYEITDGFDHLPRAFYQALNSTILLNSKVRLISQTSSNVTVSYQDWRNPSSLTNLTVDYALVTATAKATLFMDFQPPLSPQKMEALRSVHYASSTKVVLSFSERFWEKEGIKGGKSITDLPSRFIYYPSHSFPGTAGGALLASYTCSDDSTLFQGVSEDELKALVLDDLVKIHGEVIRPLCTGGLVKKWGLDPFSLGAFAIYTPYQQTDYASDLFRNESRVHFAGEHTALPHAWIETAMKSALRAARNISNLA